MQLMFLKSLKEFSEHLQSPIILRTFFALLVIYWIFWLWSRRKLYVISAKLPGPLWLPLIGNGLQLKIYRPGTELAENILNLCKKYQSPFRLWSGFEFSVVITEPVDLEEVLSSKIFTNKDERYESMTKCIGPGIVSSSGRIWRKHRQILNPSFCTATLRSYHPNQNKHARYLVRNLMEVCDKGPVETKGYCARFVADTAIESMFGIEKSFYKGNEDSVLNLSVILSELILDRMTKFWQQWDSIYSLSKNSKLCDDYMAKYRQYYHPLVREKIRNHTKNIENDVTEDTKLQSIKTPFTVLLDAYTDGLISEQGVIDEFDHMYNASISTSFSQVAFFMLMMGMHKDVQNKLYMEVQDVFGEKIDDDLEVTAEDLRILPYLKMCIQESFRLFPTAPIASRMVTEDYHLNSKDITIPAGTHIVVSSYATHRDPKYWDKPYSYMPERFSPEECRKRPQFSYIAFHGGSRDCIGQNYVTDEMRVAAVHLIKNYKFHSDLTLDKLKLCSDLTVRSANGYKVSITKRK